MNELVCEYKGQLIESEEMKSRESQYVMKKWDDICITFNSKGKKL